MSKIKEFLQTEEYIAIKGKEIILELAVLIFLAIFYLYIAFSSMRQQEYINALEQKVDKLEEDNWNMVYELDGIKQEISHGM